MPNQERSDTPLKSGVVSQRPTNKWRAQRFYRSLTAQRAIVLLVLAAAVGLQYYLVNMPVADLSRAAQFNPAKVVAADQVVVFANPETEPGRFGFTYDQPGKERMLVDVYFDKALLSKETIQRLATLGVKAPSEPSAVGYLTSAVHSGTCSTAIQVDAVSTNEGTRTVQFSQSVKLSERYRTLGVDMAGFDSTVTLTSQGAFDASNQSPCQAELYVGHWRKITAGFLPIKVHVLAGSDFRFQWEASDVQPQGFPTTGPANSLLTFGEAQRQSFHATEVRVLSAPPSSPLHSLVARSEHKNVPLTIGSFMVGSDQLQLSASGRGLLLQDGKVISTANLLEAISKYPLIAALFGAANIGLLNWAKRKFFPARARPKSAATFSDKRSTENKAKANRSMPA
jgi:hypothetical protein